MGDLSKELQNEIEKLEPDEAHALGQIMRALKDGDRSKLRTFLEPDYLEQPVSIERFLDDERYLGRPLWDFEKHRSKIYPYWREKLKMVFESESIHEIIATGPIGSGKSLFLDVALAYIVHSDILCLKDPFAYYNLVRAQPISILFFSLSKDLSSVGLFRGFCELLLASPWFTERGTISGHRYKVLNFPQHNVEWSLGAPKMAGQGITGRNILGGALDEISEVVDPKERERDLVAVGDSEFKHMRALNVYQAVKRRIESRFMQGGYNPGKLFLASSKQDEAAFLEQYVNRVKDHPGVLIFDDPLWEIKPKDNYCGKTFVVAIGDRFRESKVLEPDEDEEVYESKNFDLIDVPVEHKPAFDFDVDGAIRDIAGISSTRTRRSKLIPRSEYLVRGVDDTLEHPFSKDTIELSEDDEIGIEDFFNLKALDRMLTLHERCLHIDLAKNGDAAGIAMCHSPSKKVIDRVEKDGTTTRMSDDIVKFDFMLQVVNMAGSEIPFWKIRRFVLWLINKGVKLVMVTTDGWQSVDTIQLLHRAGVEAEVLSLDKTHDQYVAFRNMFYEERVQHSGHPIFMKEAEELEHNRIKKKVDHPYSGCFTADVRIPLLDGTCPTIEELVGKEVWVYSSREDGVTVPGVARGRLTKRVTELVDVVLDTGAVVRCTPEHLWMLRDGTYKEAQHLRPGIDRLRHLKRTWPVNGGYENLSDMSGTKTLTHHMVESYMNGPIQRGWLVHHGNENKTDNRPGNLSRSKSESHARDHATKRHSEDSEYSRKVAAGLQRFNLSEEGRRKHSEAMKRMCASRTKETLRAAAEKRSGFRSDIGIDSLHLAAGDYAVVNSNMASKFLGCGRNVVMRVLKDNGFKSWEEFAASRGENHRVRYVISVVLKEPVPVYDLEVDQWHNFALSAGIFVHNSKDVADAACGCAWKCAAGRESDPETEKQLETMKNMTKELQGGFGNDMKWWMQDV